MIFGAFFEDRKSVELLSAKMLTEVGHHVQKFYNETPFPDYELSRFNSEEDLVLHAYPFARILNRVIPKNASVIDVGTGTGQLSAFLSLGRECVYGIDFSDSSLIKARALKKRLKLNSWHLSKVDILNQSHIDEIGMKFDYVLCMGVLHHTGNAYRAFKNILKLVKPRGYVAIGLYNKLGRVPHKIRRVLASTIFWNNERVKDYFMRMQIGKIDDRERARGWWNDQYMHPHETTHTIGEVLRWFKENGIEFYETVPSVKLSNEVDFEIAGVWNKDNRVPNFAVRAYTQLTWIWRTHHEGGYWITLGRKTE